MIIREDVGDLFNCQSQTLACTTNSVGAMGKGVALEFRKRVDGLYEFYQRRNPPMPYALTPRLREDVERRAHVLDVYPIANQGKQVLLFPTKYHWRDNSPLELIEDNLRTLSQSYQNLGIESLAIPALGCGNGGLLYDRDVRPLVWTYLNPLPIPVEVLFQYQAVIRY